MSEEEEVKSEPQQELTITKQESRDRDLLAEAGYLHTIKENALGQRIQVQLNVIGFMTDVVRKFKGLS